MSAIFSTSIFAASSPWSVGVGAAYSPNVYKGTPSNRTVIPIVGYEGEHFFMRGFSAGYRLNPRGSVHNFVFRLIYDPRSYNASDSDDADMKLLDDRDATILGGMSYQLLTQVGMFETSVGSDIGSEHNGLYGEVAWRVPFRTPFWGLTPAVGYSYNNEKLNQHLYGVSKSESQRTGGNIEAFSPDAAGYYFIGLSGYLNVGDNVTFNGGVRYTNLEGDIEDSPILDGTESVIGNLGVTYTF